MPMYRFCLLVMPLAVWCWSSCSRDKAEVPLLELLPLERTGVAFNNRLLEDAQLNILTFEYFNNGAGVGAGDFDRDGRVDLFFAGNMEACRLYLNRGDFTFVDQTAAAGIDTRGRWVNGVAVVDLNADGWLDIYLSCAGPYPPERRANLLYINQGNGQFIEQAQAYGLADTGHTTQAVFFDYDRDGDLDAYLLTNSMEEDLGPNVIRPKRTQGQNPNTDRLFRNDGGWFTNVSSLAGILTEGYGLGVSVNDFNLDGWPDIYVSNDYVSNDLLWMNQGDGTFRDMAAQLLDHTSYSAMGNDVGDYNNDGWPDIVAVDMLPPDHLRRKLMLGGSNYDRFRSEIRSGYSPQFVRNTLQLHRGLNPAGEPSFSEVGHLAGIAATDWSWSPLWGDLDHDGWQDLLITNGYPHDITNLDFATFKKPQLFAQGQDPGLAQRAWHALQNVPGAYLPNFIFRNKGNLQFEEVSRRWGFTQPAYSHGALLADLDNDGDLDYVVNNYGAPAFIYANRSERLGRHFLRVQLEGLGGNRQALGATVKLYQGQQQQTRYVQAIRGYLSSVETTVHFGFAQATPIDSVVVIWPNQQVQVWRGVAPDQLLTCRQDASSARRQTPAKSANRCLTEATVETGLNHQHLDPQFTDFKIQPLLLREYCQQGPPLASGDFNADGRADFFVGGAYRQSGQIFLQTPTGRFKGFALDPPDKKNEDTGATAFDADGDGDLDLYVCSGGSEFPNQAAEYQDRLYYNNGQGRFTLAPPGVLPPLTSSTSTVAAADWDRDGDLDLFVGGRIVPTAYAAIPRSYLLENRGGRFVSVTQQLQPALGAWGRVTAAQWGDLNGDGWPDLVVTGEWQATQIFYNRQGKKLDPAAAGDFLGNGVGWWNALLLHDLDQDGDLDLLLGNEGLNHEFAQTAQSLCLHTGDFDDNGRPDALFSQVLLGQRAPVHFRDDLLAWFPFLRKHYPDYQTYASTTWTELEKHLARSKTASRCVEEWRSGWAENQQGRWVFHPWPMLAQLAPIQAMVVADFDGDQLLDVLCGGNDYGRNPFWGYQDAGKGLILQQGPAAGQFVASSYGVPLAGPVRSLLPLTRAGGDNGILVGVNHSSLRWLRLGTVVSSTSRK